MKKLVILMSSILVIGLAGCSSTKTVTYTEQEYEYIKDYIEFSNTYIEDQLSKSTESPRKVAEPYRARYQLVLPLINK